MLGDPCNLCSQATVIGRRENPKISKYQYIIWLQEDQEGF